MSPLFTNEKEILRIAWDELDRLNALWDMDVDMRMNRRLRGAWAATRGTLAQYYAPANTIQLGPAYPSPDNLINSVRHEFAHALQYIRDGYLSHNHEWEHYADRVGAWPAPRASAETIAWHMAQVRVNEVKVGFRSWKSLS